MKAKRLLCSKKPFDLSILLFLFLLLPSSFSYAFRDLGIPIKEAVGWGVHAGPGKAGSKDTIYVSFAQYQAPLFLLAVNPDTGEMRQFNGPLSSEMGSWGFTTDHQNRIYLGSYYGAHLLRFDPGTETWEDLGQPSGEKESFICSLTTAPDGRIWGGTFPSATLFCYDPVTGKTERFGRMDPDQFYCYPTAGGDGLIYCAIQFEKIDIVLFDPEKKSKISLIPPEERKPGRITLIRGTDGSVYAKLPTRNTWCRIEERGRLIEVSNASVPVPEKGLPDGRTFHLVENNLLVIETPATKQTQEIPLQYAASGSYLFVIGPGPDLRLYGSSMLPLRLFSYDPEKDLLSNLGKASTATGEVYSVGTLDGKLYLCSYPEARLSVYDPNKPLHFGENQDSNPRDLGPMGEGLYRPRVMLAGPKGRVYVGGYPDYGLLGGALGVYDPLRNEKRSYRNVIPNQSLASLAYLETVDLIAAGSSVRGGTGTRATEKEAKLILWDPNDEKKRFEIVPVPESKTILSLAVAPNGALYGITDNEKVFVFDAKQMGIRKVYDLGLKDPLEISLQAGPDGKLYGLAREAVFSVDPETGQVAILGKPPVPISVGMGQIGRKIYFGSGAHLWEFEIPSDTVKPIETGLSPLPR
jgi:hypothetical protein